MTYENYFDSAAHYYYGYANGQDYELIKLWETDCTIDLPESVILNKESDVLYEWAVIQMTKTEQ